MCQDAAGPLQRRAHAPALLFLCSSNNAFTPGRSLNALPKSALRRDMTDAPAAMNCARRALVSPARSTQHAARSTRLYSDRGRHHQQIAMLRLELYGRRHHTRRAWRGALVWLLRRGKTKRRPRELHGAVGWTKSSTLGGLQVLPRGGSVGGFHAQLHP